MTETRLGHVTIAHQDGTASLPIIRASFHYQDALLSVFVEAEAAPNSPEADIDNLYAYPDCALLGFVDVPCPLPPRAGDRWSFRTTSTEPRPEPMSGLPRANAYFGHLALDLDVTLRVVDVAATTITIDLVFITEDVNYYDERARPTTTRVEGVTLGQCARADLWDP